MLGMHTGGTTDTSGAHPVSSQQTRRMLRDVPHRQEEKIMHQFRTAKAPVAVFAGLSLVGALAGCASTAADAGTTNASSTAVYKDGTYAKSASYQSPNGTETVDVTVTLAKNTITAVSVVGHGTSPNSQFYQSQFASGIGAVVVGKDINKIRVDKVGGSSLTSGGFNTAIKAIKVDAAP